jgi:hypothetical protein
MAITAREMNNLRDLVGDVIEQRLEPRFAKIDGRFDGVDSRLDRMERTLGSVQEDVAVIKDMVKDHSFEIARLKHKIA